MNLLNTINTKVKDDIRLRVMLVLCGVLMIIYRGSEIFIYPRIWAEEGKIFYAFARHHSVWDIFTTVHVGYLTLFNSIVSVIQARFFSVENAATVSVWLAFFVQITPVYIIAFTTHKFWDNAIKKIICTLIVVTVLPPELYVNTTNSHFIFGIITFLIMMVAPNELSSFQKYFFRVLLFLGGLTGPVSIFFTPTFLFKAYREKNKEKYIQAGILTVCAIIQACAILHSIFFNNTYKRLSVHDVKTTRYHFIIDNFSLLPHTTPWLHIHFISFDLITILGMLIGSFYIYLTLKNIKKTDYLIPLVSVFFVGLLSTLGSLSMSGGTRYSYVPTCVLLLVLTSQSFEIKRNYVALFTLTFCLSINIFYYPSSLDAWGYKPTYPKWKNEVAKWRADSTYNPKLHPAFIGEGEWDVKL
ncbi:MAG TPA: hypothetical protein VK835_14620 [Bacteroidia bacterium]|jgi:hypothetical protein|nr:hypothetical protein [Bacteroidia bacterium]